RGRDVASKRWVFLDTCALGPARGGDRQSTAFYGGRPSPWRIPNECCRKNPQLAVVHVDVLVLVLALVIASDSSASTDGTDVGILRLPPPVRSGSGGASRHPMRHL